MPRFGELEVGLTSDQSGPWRVSLNITRGTGLEGGHMEDMGLSAPGMPVSVPDHRHAVELGIVRHELVTTYSFAENRDVWLRVPYDVKDRTASLVDIDPAATPAEITAMQNNLEIHHGTKTLKGFSDFSLLAAEKTWDVLREGDILAVAVGTSIPVGKTEDDPYVLGEAGLPHEHIQFGSGSFDPLLEVYYFSPVAEGVHFSGSVLGKFPLYENSKGYRAPVQLSSTLSLALTPTDQLNLHAGWSFYYESYAHWDGKRDINSGITTNAAVGGASYMLSDDVYVSLDIRVPISQNTRSDDGDTFEQGTVAQLGLSYSF